MYNPNVRIGNWFEDLKLTTEKAKIHLQKKKSGKLFVQRTRELFCNLLREVSLSKNVEFIKYGDCIQLKAPYMPLNGNNQGLVMAGTVHENDINDISKFADGCAVLCSPCTVPCVRNTLLIKPAAHCHDEDGHALLFGREFVFQLVDSANETLYIRSEIPLIDGPHGPLDHNPVRISNKKDCYCKWKVLPWKANKRIDMEGTPVSPHARLIIKHVMTGMCLSVETSEWYFTIFGKECGVSVHTYADVHKQETAECLWMFVTGDD